MSHLKNKPTNPLSLIAAKQIVSENELKVQFENTAISVSTPTPTKYNNTCGDYAHITVTPTKLTATPTITGNDGTVFILKKTSASADKSKYNCPGCKKTL
jgi:hypothetical protein